MSDSFEDRMRGVHLELSKRPRVCPEHHRCTTLLLDANRAFKDGNEKLAYRRLNAAEALFYELNARTVAKD